MNGISNGDGTYKQLSDSDALVGKASDLPNPLKSIAENLVEVKDGAIKNYHSDEGMWVTEIRVSWKQSIGWYLAIATKNGNNYRVAISVDT